MQIVDRGSAENKTDTFANNNEICVRYIEEDIMTRDTTCFNVFLEEWGDANQLYTNPAVFRYVAEGAMCTVLSYKWTIIGQVIINQQQYLQAGCLHYLLCATMPMYV